MKYSSVIGVSAPELGWVPSPGFILRRSAIMDLVRNMTRGRVLEMGCGPGGMLYELGRLGFQGVGVEISERSRAVSKELLKEYPNVEVVETADKVHYKKFNYLFSFEVLEHVEDDIATLKAWVSFLRQDGIVLLSVPANKKKWNVTDIMAGHYRRYDRKDVEELLESAGLEISQLLTYGWPFSLILEKVRLWVRTYRLRESGINVNEISIGDLDLTKKSGVERKEESRLFKYYGNKIIGQPLFYLITSLQRCFYHTELGISYLILAKKKS